MCEDLIVLSVVDETINVMRLEYERCEYREGERKAVHMHTTKAHGEWRNSSTDS